MTTDLNDSFNSAHDANAWSDRYGDPFSEERVAATAARVTQTGILEKLAAWSAEDNQATGRAGRPLVSERAILVGLLLLASEHRALWISSLAEVFQYRLTPKSRALLGLPTATNGIAGDYSRPERWLSHTKNAFHRMLALMDPFPHDRSRALTSTEVQAALDGHDSIREGKMKTRLDEFTNGFLQMAFMQQPLDLRRPTSRIDISVGHIFIESPTTTGFSRKTLAAKVAAETGADPRTLQRGPTDVFAGWDFREWKKGDNAFAWGWMANIAVRVDSECTALRRFPTLAVSATLSMPNVAIAQETVSLMRAALDTGLEPGIVDADRPYLATAPAELIHESAFNLGFIPATNYRVDQPVESLGQRPAFDYESPEWEAFHGHAQTSVEQFHAAVQNPGRESIGESSRRAVYGFAAAQVFVTILLTNYNLRTIAAFLHKD
ncbi:hypothetical protein [Cryobacterium sp. TMT2-4]|uniref:hypothetical protein n=1 Tax=Cryobacterium sp. TMT2-4 TaxID=1259254 RepID=UPI001068F9D2|nr:hypothetical protein [Cryobacterium sp. TMT2-4]TFC67803.1 hypothetical protein E3O54_08310 [Cryobacterium sp. TMT2-4]